MNHHKLVLRVLFVFFIVFLSAEISFPKGQARGRRGIVVDERLAALRRTPNLSGELVRRLGRGRRVAIRGSKTTPDGIVFLLVNVTSRTHGWIQREAIVSNSRTGDDTQLLHLIEASNDFDRIVRARIFLDHFPRSPLRPRVLLILGNAAQSQAPELSRNAAKRLSQITTPLKTPLQAPEFTYFLNYSGLDRYNRQRVTFIFHAPTKRLYYDGAAWRELLRRHPNSPESAEARKHLSELAAISQ